MVSATSIDHIATPGGIAASPGERQTPASPKNHLDNLIRVPSTRVVARPHYRLDGNALFFMASTRPHCQLSPAELEIWCATKQPLTLGELRERFSASADDVVRTFWRRELCELIEADFPQARRRVLVIEPHPDDAALSIAGAMWLRRHECEFVVATLAGRSNYTSYYNLDRDYFDVDGVANLRRQESELFVQMVGGRHVSIGRTDAALRYRDVVAWSLDYFRRNRMAIAAATSRTADAAERLKWTKDVLKLLADTPSEEVWIPLGAPHADHVLTTNACLAAFVAQPELVADRTVKVYQDVPYAARTPYFSNEMLSSLEHAGVKLDSEAIPIAGVFEQKLRLVSLYASQFKIEAMRRDIEASARGQEMGPGLSERFWTVGELPARLDRAGIFPESADKKEQEDAADEWMTRNRRARRVRVLLLLPTGRWASDIERLRETFPAADFEVIAAPAAAAEVSDMACARVDLRIVGSGTAAWVRLALRLAVARPMPTLFHVGDRRMREGRWLSRLWPCSDTLVVASMNRVVRAAERRIGTPDEQADGGERA